MCDIACTVHGLARQYVGVQLRNIIVLRTRLFQERFQTCRALTISLSNLALTRLLISPPLARGQARRPRPCSTSLAQVRRSISLGRNTSVWSLLLRSRRPLWWCMCRFCSPTLRSRRAVLVNVFIGVLSDVATPTNLLKGVVYICIIIY